MHRCRLPGPLQESAKRGTTLFVVTTMLASLSIVALTFYTLTVIERGISVNYNCGTEALYMADAGVEYVKARVESDVRSGALNLDSPIALVNYLAPGGFDFAPVPELVRLSDNRSYTYQVEGFGCGGNAESRIEVVLTPAQSFEPGLFGDEALELSPGTRVFSYDAEKTPEPSPADSTHEATAGSNEEISGDMGAVDGFLYLGASPLGEVATLTGGLLVDGLNASLHVERIDPDPLGLVEGYLADEFARVALENDNQSLSVGRVNDGSVRIEAGGRILSGDYYVEAIELSSGDTLQVDSAEGPVNLYVVGPIAMEPGSRIDVVHGTPSSLRIYAATDEPITIEPGGDFHGLVYAPRAELRFAPEGNGYGALWTKHVSLLPGGQYYLDTALIHDLLYSRLEIASWKELEN